MSPESIPSPIVAALDALADELEQWAKTHRTSTLANHEQAVLQAVRRRLGALLGAVLTRALRLDHPIERQRRRPCPQCGRRRAPQFRQRHPMTVCGVTPLDRPYYYCRTCRVSWTPADRVLDLAPQQVLSDGLQAWVAAEGGEHAFARAAARIERLTGIGLGAETVRTHTEAVGTALVTAQAAAAEQVQRTQEAAEPRDPAPALLLVETDGVMVRYRDRGPDSSFWHEMKIGLVAGCRVGNGHPLEAPDHVPPVLVQPSYVAARLPAEHFGPVLLAEAARRGALEVVGWEQLPGVDPRLAGVCGPSLAMLRPVIVLGDGAHWIWALAAEQFGAARTEIVDAYHAVQHLWALGRAIWGPNDPHVARWVRRAKTVLQHRGGAVLLRHLRRLRSTAADDPDALRREQGYFTTNRARMAYPTFLAQGLPIGSGAIESAARHVVQQRLKQPGTRWGRAGAQAVAAVAAYRASERPLPPVHSPPRRAA